MTNKERYRKAFGSLHASEEVVEEIYRMAEADTITNIHTNINATVNANGSRGGNGIGNGIGYSSGNRSGNRGGNGIGNGIGYRSGNRGGDRSRNRSGLRLPKGVLAACAAAAVVLGSFGGAYAANVGNIQRRIQLWLHGDLTDAEITFAEDGTYTVTYESGGEQKELSGGGMAFERDGTARRLTQEELLENLDGPEVEFKEDGTVWVYYRDQTIEITDKFDDDGTCYIKLRDGDETSYLTVDKTTGNTAWSQKRFEDV